MITYKICSNRKCTFNGTPQTVDNFAKNAAARDGLQYRCKTCISAYDAALYQADPEKTNNRCKKWYANNSGKENKKERRKASPEKEKEYSARYRAKHPEYWRGRFLRAEYWPHLTWEQALTEYDRLLRIQDNCCAICKKPEEMISKGKKLRLAVDHCHNSNVVRGLLCTACNKAIGLLQDNPDLIRAAADYVEKHQPATVIPFPTERTVKAS